MEGRLNSPSHAGIIVKRQKRSVNSLPGLTASFFHLLALKHGLCT